MAADPLNPDLGPTLPPSYENPLSDQTPAPLPTHTSDAQTQPDTLDLPKPDTEVSVTYAATPQASARITTVTLRHPDPHPQQPPSRKQVTVPARSGEPRRNTKYGAAMLAGAFGLGAMAVLKSLTQSSGYSFRDRVVLITGGSRGLGLELARRFAAEGARLALVARSHEELRQAAADLIVPSRRSRREPAPDVLTIAADLREPSEARRAVEETISAFGTIDVLINNAGVIQVGPLEHMTPADFENEMAIHFRAPLHTMYTAIPHMKRQGSGRIVNVASFGGLVAVPHMAPYAASKFALVGMSDAFRTELAPENIYVTTVNPGVMRVGSHLRAQFKGRHAEEFAWFSNFSGMPGYAVEVTRAAREIVEACRAGQPRLTIGWQAKALKVADRVAPNTMARTMSLVASMLPRPTSDPEGDVAREGYQIRNRAHHSPLISRADRMASRSHELPPAPGSGLDADHPQPDSARDLHIHSVRTGSVGPPDPMAELRERKSSSMSDQNKSSDQQGQGGIPPQPESSAGKGASSPASNSYQKPSQAEGDEETIDEALENQEQK